MKVWHFTEQSYEPGWHKTDGPIRIVPPSRLCDPEDASALLNRYLDEWVAADELGLNIMVNEHHTTMSSISPSCMLQLAVLARQTKRARLLALGIPIANRPDPFRIAEEIALVDLLSRGRFELGFVRGVPYEVFSSNQNPVRMGDRFTEAHDLILKALTHLDGPFSWEGEYFNYRAINVWPRCYQQPHPPVWMPGQSESSGQRIARYGYVCAAFLDGGGAKKMFKAYREAYQAAHKRPAAPDRLAFCGLVCVGRDKAEVDRRASLMKTYLPTLRRTSPGIANPPGYRPIEVTAASLRAGEPPQGFRMLNGRPLPANPTDEELISAGTLFVGTPDQVFNQIKSFHRAVGGFGNLIIMAQAGSLGHADTIDNLTLFAREVYPRLADLDQAVDVAEASVG